MYGRIWQEIYAQSEFYSCAEVSKCRHISHLKINLSQSDYFLSFSSSFPVMVLFVTKVSFVLLCTQPLSTFSTCAPISSNIPVNKNVAFRKMHLSLFNLCIDQSYFFLDPFRFFGFIIVPVSKFILGFHDLTNGVIIHIITIRDDLDGLTWAR